MGRPLRLKTPGLTYHITSRTNGKRLFLKKKQDQKALCKILKLILLKLRFPVKLKFNAEWTCYQKG